MSENRTDKNGFVLWHRPQTIDLTDMNKGDGKCDKDKDCFIYWDLRTWLCSVHVDAVQSFPFTKTYPVVIFYAFFCASSIIFQNNA